MLFLPFSTNPYKQQLHFLPSMLGNSNDLFDLSHAYPLQSFVLVMVSWCLSA
jgi:hypothetical protein